MFYYHSSCYCCWFLLQSGIGTRLKYLDKQNRKTRHTTNRQRRQRWWWWLPIVERIFHRNIVAFTQWQRLSNKDLHNISPQCMAGDCQWFWSYTVSYCSCCLYFFISLFSVLIYLFLFISFQSLKPHRDRGEIRNSNNK